MANNKTFYWKGNLGSSGETFAKSYDVPWGGPTPTDAYQARRLEAVCWNRKENWFERVEGNTGMSGGQNGPSTGGFHLIPATRVPGGGDIASFRTFDNTHGVTGFFPTSPCLFGGFWNGYWAGNTSNQAGYTGDLHQLIVEKSYGSLRGSTNWPYHYSHMNRPQERLGFEPNSDYNRFQLQDNFGLGRTISGITMTGITGFGTGTGNAPVNGLRITSRYTLIEPAGDFMFQATRSDLGRLVVEASRKSDISVRGGTCSQAEFNGPALPTTVGTGGWVSSDSFMKVAVAPEDFMFRKVGAAAGEANMEIQLSMSIGDFAYLADNTTEGRFNVTGTCPTVVINSEIRPKRMNLAGNYTNAYVYPQKRLANAITEQGHNTVIFGKGSSGGTNTNITNLFVKDSNDSDRTVYPRADVANVADGDIMQGCNNLVALEPVSSYDSSGEVNVTIDDLQLEAGRVMVGHFVDDLYGSGKGYPQNQTYSCGSQEENNILIKKGDIYSKGVLDGRHQTDPTYKSFKVGPGVSHPTEDQGMRINGFDSQIILPTDMRFVSDYPTGQTGKTMAGNPLVPTLQRARKSTK